MKNLKFLVSFIIGLISFMSCSNNDDSIVATTNEDIMAVFKHIKIENNRYVFDDVTATNEGLLPDAITQVSDNILILNKYLDTEDEYIANYTDSLNSYNLRLIDFEKFDLNKIGEDDFDKDLYVDVVLFERESSEKKPALSKRKTSGKIGPLDTQGAIYTYGQTEKFVKYDYNTSPVVQFQVKGNTAPVSFHTVRVRSTFGDWKVSTITSTAYSYSRGSLRPYTTEDFLQIGYRTGDPKGGICKYQF